MAFTRLGSFSRSVWWRLLTIHYARQLKPVDACFQVKGICRIRNAGRIELGEGCIIDSSWARPVRVDVGRGATLRFGSRVYVNEGVHITCNIGVSIGDRCLIAPDVEILDDDGHPVDWRNRHEYWPDGPETRLGAPIVIEDNVWIGTRAIILKGVTVGKGSVVGAAAVVTRSVPPSVMVAGVPARVVREI